MAGNRAEFPVAALIAFASGVVVGAAGALLFAPASGRESREILRGYAKRAEDALRDFVGEAAETWDEVLEPRGDLAAPKRPALRDAGDAGRGAMPRKGDLSGGRQE